MTLRDTIATVHEPSARSDAAYALSVDILLTASEAGESSREWRPAPGELVSLWDMLRFHAFYFVNLFATIRTCEEALRLGAGFLKIQNQGEDEIKLQDDNRNALGTALDDLKGECEKLGLPISILKIDRIKGIWSSIKGNEIANQLNHLAELVRDELSSKLFMFIPTEQVKYCPDGVERWKPPLFGEVVQDKFPELTADIVDAGWCLCLERSTASVYHLMCIVEFGIKRIAMRFKVKKRQVTNKAWGQIFGALNTAIAALPYGSNREKARKDKYNEVMIYLNSVKDAWRNPTMHSRRRFTQEEAETVFDTVKAFTNFLATKRI
jgi:hypothetical protein